MTPRGQQHPLAVRGEGRVGQEVLRLLDPALALLVEVAPEVDVELARGGRLCEVHQVEVGAQRVDDAAAVGGRVADVPTLVRRVLAQVAALGVDRPQVDAAVAVGQEGDAILAARAVGQGTAVVVALGQQRAGFGLVGQVHDPQPGDGAPAVLARVVAAQAVAGEVQRVAVGAQGRVARLADGQLAALAGFHVDGEELQARATVQPGVEHLTGRGDAPDLQAAALPGQAARHAPGNRHHVDLGPAVVLRREGQPLPVGRDGRLGFLAGVGRQPLGIAALGAHAPEVAFSHQEDLVAPQRGLAVVALGGGDSAGGGRGEQGQREGGESQAGHGVLPGSGGIVGRPIPRAIRHVDKMIRARWVHAPPLCTAAARWCR